MHYAIPGEQRQPQQDMSAPLVSSVGDIHLEYAQVDQLADIDTFMDWLHGECHFVERVSSEWEARDPKRLAAAITPVVLHALLVAGLRGDAVGALQAARDIVRRYLKASEDAIQRRAGLAAAEGEQARRFA